MSNPKINLEKKTVQNKHYRRVVYTDKKLQLVLMSLDVGDTIPREKHAHTSQFIRVEDGEIVVHIDKSRYHLKDGDSIVISPGTWHEVKQTGNVPAKLYTIYTPPEHAVDARVLHQP